MVLGKLSTAHEWLEVRYLEEDTELPSGRGRVGWVSGKVEEGADIPRIQSRDVEGIQRGRIGVGLCVVGIELDGLKVRLEALLQFNARLLRALSAAAITNHVSHGCARGIPASCGSVARSYLCSNMVARRSPCNLGRCRVVRQRVCEREVRKVVL